MLREGMDAAWVWRARGRTALRCPRLSCTITPILASPEVLLMRKAHCGILKFMTAMDATIPPDLDPALDFIREFLYNSHTQAHQHDRHTQAHQRELIRVRQRELIYELACRNLTMKLDLIQKASNLPPREADFYYQQIDELSKLLDSILQEAEHEMMRISHQEGRRARQNLRDGAGELDAPALAHSNASAVPLSASTADLLARTTLPGLDDDDAREVRRILEDPEYAELVTARHRALVSASALARSLSTREVADMTGRSPAAITRSAGRSLYAYHLGRSLRFPTWQFDDDGRPLPGLATVVPALREGLTPMTVEARMTCTDPEILDGLSPVEWLAHGSDPAEATRVLTEMDRR